MSVSTSPECRLMVARSEFSIHFNAGLFREQASQQANVGSGKGQL